MGKEHQQPEQGKKAPLKKTIKRKPLVDTVTGEREYHVKPIVDFEAYKELKDKRFNKYKKEAVKSIILDKFLIKSAAESLKKFQQSHQSADLFENEGFVYLEIVMGRLPEEHSIRPVQIPLPVPIYGEQFNTRSLIFVADPSRDYKDKIQDLTIPTIAKVIGYEKLKKQYTKYK